MPDVLAPLLRLGSGLPDRLTMLVPDVGEEDAQHLALDAVYAARTTMPRVTGATANRLVAISGAGWFGIYFPDPWTWFMEHGTGPYTMRSLAGKTVPMWVYDEDGKLRTANPKIKVRRTLDGRTQVLIFRKAAKIGQRKQVHRRNRWTGQVETVWTVASYPGAPGRINRRSTGIGWEQGPAGQVAAGNVGVRWRHPGLRALQFLDAALAGVAFRNNISFTTVYATNGAEWERFLARGGL
jgi:hypothetical protein